jgi:hypothetical protein
MYVRSRVVKGRTYYQVVESYRDGGRVRQRHLCSLGAHPTIEEARREALGEYFVRKRRRRECEEIWDRVLLLDRLLRKAQGPAYREDPQLQAERRRRGRAADAARAARRQADAARRQARQEARKRAAEAFEEEMARRADQFYQDLRVYGLLPSEKQIRDAYRRESRKLHPDKGGRHEGQVENTARRDRLLSRVRRRHQEDSEDGDRTMRRGNRPAIAGDAS